MNDNDQGLKYAQDAFHEMDFMSEGESLFNASKLWTLRVLIFLTLLFMPIEAHWKIFIYLIFCFFDVLVQKWGFLIANQLVKANIFNKQIFYELRYKGIADKMFEHEMLREPERYKEFLERTGNTKQKTYLIILSCLGYVIGVVVLFMFGGGI